MPSTFDVTLRKVSDLSDCRPAAKGGKSTQEMFKRFRAMYAEHRASGILSAAGSGLMRSASTPKGGGKEC